MRQREIKAQQEFAARDLWVREQVLGELWYVRTRVQSLLDPVKRNDGLAGYQGVHDLVVHGKSVFFLHADIHNQYFEPLSVGL